MAAMEAMGASAEAAAADMAATAAVHLTADLLSMPAAAAGAY